MSIFGSIMSKIFGTEAKSAEAAAPAASGGIGAGSAGTAGGLSTASSTTSAHAGPAGGTVDVEAVLTDMAKKAGRPSNWRVSIVDLMTLLGLDSSFAHRKELAQELGYTGSTADSATMNIWLHKQVMRKLAENGGKVPDDLKAA